MDDCFQEFLESGIDDVSVWFDFLKEQQNKRTIYYNQETNLFRIHKSAPQEIPFKQRAKPGQRIEEETLLRRESRRNLEVPYLSSGGWINVLTFRPFLDGHIDVTKRVLAHTFKFLYAAQAIASDASKDPDFYSWTEDAAHAQTPSDSNGRADDANIGNEKPAIKAFAHWLSNRSNSVKHYCDKGEPQFALYALGYSLHAVQDLAAHNGRTFAEHSWNSYCNNLECDNNQTTADKEGDPDDDEDNISLAEKYSILFLNDVRRLVGEDCWTSMKSYDGPQLSWLAKRATFNLKRSLTLSAYNNYKEARFAFAKSNKGPAYRIRWLPGDSDRRNEHTVSSLWTNL